MHVNPQVVATEFPPVTEAASWIRDRTFPTDKPLIDVSQAVPGYATSDAVLDHMAEVLRKPETSKYGHALGLPELRARYAETLCSTANEVSADNIAISAGCNQAFHVAITALVKPGEQVILPAPWYFNHKMSLDMLGVETSALPCTEAKQMVPDVDELKRLINPKTRAVVLITPNNPTGQEYPVDTIDAIYKLCKEAGVYLIVDETYRDFRAHNTTPPHNIFTDPDWGETAIHLYSFSKAYALAGYRVGAIASSQNLLREITKVLDCVSICAPQLSQQAALFALTNAQDWKAQRSADMHARAKAFTQAINATEHGYEIAASGAYFAYLRHPFEIDSTGVARFLADNANLLALPGDMFGPNQERYIRVAFANVTADWMAPLAERLVQNRPDQHQI